MSKLLRFFATLLLFTLATYATVNCEQTQNVQSFVQRFYVTILEREPDVAGLDDWTNKLIAHERTGATLAEGFIFSDEYTSKAVSDESYVSTLYKAFFNREAELRGLAYWLVQLEQYHMSREVLLTKFLHSKEFETLSKSYGIKAYEGATLPTVVHTQNTDSNTPPQANAGADQSVVQGTEVTLDSSLSQDSDSTIACYWWREGASILSTHAQYPLETNTLALGRHTLLLSVADDKGVVATDALVLEIKDLDETGGGTTDSTENNNTNNTDDNTTEQNTTATLKSLTLTLAETSLNKDETTNLSLEATYSNNTSKTLTNNIEWIVSPSDAVQITDHTLTAKKDSNVTLQAKVGNILSNTISLNITWRVNGHTLPPEPNKTLNDSTLLGIDVNDNGVRDDVERYILQTYGKEEIIIQIGFQVSRAYNTVIEHPENAWETDKVLSAAYDCESYFRVFAKYFSEPLLLKKEEEILTSKKFKSIMLNTRERIRNYLLYEQKLSGGIFTSTHIDERKAKCSFEVDSLLKARK